MHISMGSACQSEEQMIAKIKLLKSNNKTPREKKEEKKKKRKNSRVTHSIERISDPKIRHAFHQRAFDILHPILSFRSYRHPLEFPIDQMFFIANDGNAKSFLSNKAHK